MKKHVEKTMDVKIKSESKQSLFSNSEIHSYIKRKQNNKKLKRPQNKQVINKNLFKHKLLKNNKNRRLI